ncbi:MAG: dihydroorotase [Dehalococcoidales bacterium]|nr:dihydroorotase [Dehalococcoidales bacterium]
MTGTLLISGGRIIDPGQKLDKTGSLLIAEGKISWLGDDTPPPADCDVLDARGLVVCPGFIDLHCHLRQPGFEEKETIASGSLAAARGGFTTICCMPNTRPPLDGQAGIDYVKSTAASEAVVRVLPIGCISKGRQGEGLAEMAEMAEAGAVAFSDDGSPVISSRLMLQTMEYSLAFGRPIIDHCEDTELAGGGQMNEGIIATRLGLAGVPAAAEENIVARDIGLAEFTGARLHIAHVSTRGSVEIIRRAREKGVRVTAEVTPHHLTLTEEEVIGYNTNAKVNPPLRTEKDIEALISGLREGVIDAIATDHAPHTENDKLCEFALAPFGISGFETALGSLMSLVHSGKLELNLLIARLTGGPAGVIGSKLGTLAIGAPADITILDPNREWVVDTAEFASKGRNTPLDGRELTGRVMATISGGRLVHQGKEMKVTAR